LEEARWKTPNTGGGLMPISIDPGAEVNYRLRLAENYLKDAEESFKRGDFRATVASSQLTVENSAKAIISVFRIPSWSHDPSHELREIAQQIPLDVRHLVEELADLAEILAPEHGRSTYGEPARGLTPWEIYSRDDAEKTLQYARKAVEIAGIILGRLRVDIRHV